MSLVSFIYKNVNSLWKNLPFFPDAYKNSWSRQSRIIQITIKQKHKKATKDYNIPVLIMNCNYKFENTKKDFVN